MSGRITDKRNGSSAVWKVEGESRYKCSSQLRRLLAVLLNARQLNIDHAVERADLSFRNANRPDGRSKPRVPRNHCRTLADGSTISRIRSAAMTFSTWSVPLGQRTPLRRTVL